MRALTIWGFYGCLIFAFVVRKPQGLSLYLLPGVTLVTFVLPLTCQNKSLGLSTVLSLPRGLELNPNSQVGTAKSGHLNRMTPRLALRDLECDVGLVENGQTPTSHIVE